MVLMLHITPLILRHGHHDDAPMLIRWLPMITLLLLRIADAMPRYLR